MRGIALRFRQFCLGHRVAPILALIVLGCFVSFAAIEEPGWRASICILRSHQSKGSVTILIERISVSGLPVKIKTEIGSGQNTIHLLSRKNSISNDCHLMLLPWVDDDDRLVVGENIGGKRCRQREIAGIYSTNNSH